MLNQQQDNDQPSALQIVKSVLMSFFGVQKNQVRERDFSKGRPLPFIITGLILTILLVLSLYLIVKLILHFALHP